MSSSFVAGGNITPSSFVSLSTTQGRTVSLSGSGDTTVIGISQIGTHLTPLLTLDDGYAAVAGESLSIYTKDDEEAYLQVGGTVAVGDLIKPNASGLGVTSSTDGDYYGARALEPGVSGQVIKVQPVFGFRGA